MSNYFNPQINRTVEQPATPTPATTPAPNVPRSNATPHIQALFQSLAKKFTRQATRTARPQPTTFEFPLTGIKLVRRDLQGKCNSNFLARYPLLIKENLYILKLKGMWKGTSPQRPQCGAIKCTLAASSSLPQFGLHRPDRIMQLSNNYSSEIRENNQLTVERLLDTFSASRSHMEAYNAKRKERYEASLTWQIQVEDCLALSEICLVKTVNEARDCLLDKKFAKRNPQHAVIQTKWFHRLTKMQKQGGKKWHEFRREVEIQMGRRETVNSPSMPNNDAPPLRAFNRSVYETDPQSTDLRHPGLSTIPTASISNIMPSTLTPHSLDKQMNEYYMSQGNVIQARPQPSSVYLVHDLNTLHCAINTQASLTSQFAHPFISSFSSSPAPSQGCKRKRFSPLSLSADQPTLLPGEYIREEEIDRLMREFPRFPLEDSTNDILSFIASNESDHDVSLPEPSAMVGDPSTSEYVTKEEVQKLEQRKVLPANLFPLSS